MIYSTSIPAYLWHNTIRRWLENPSSPATKLLVPFLFGILALTVFGLLRGIEAELQEQLARSDLRSITITEFVSQDEAENRYHVAMEFPFPWSDWCESSDLLLQAPLSASSRFFERMPVIGYITKPSFISITQKAPGEAREAVILTSQIFPEKIHTEGDIVTISNNYNINAKILPLPTQFANIFQSKAILLVPAEMLEVALVSSHTRLQILNPLPNVSPTYLESLIRLYAAAEDKDYQLYSAQKILTEIDNIARRQELARIILAFGFALIMSLILGSLSLLEFRQELYLFALLRSFGVKPINLFIHYILETLLITLSGFMAALWISHKLIPSILEKQKQTTQLSIPFSMESINQSDLYILLISLVAGVFISSLPILPGLRKPAGLLLP
jgi:ABC-type antimicrobial peptide transport system permease subunit